MKGNGYSRLIRHLPLMLVERQAASYPYVIPETVNYNVWAEPSARNFLRKAGFDFGWDW